jgi:hypothetical protein
MTRPRITGAQGKRIAEQIGKAIFGKGTHMTRAAAILAIRDVIAAESFKTPANRLKSGRAIKRR